jgi:integrase
METKATVKLVLDPKVSKNEPRSIKLRVTHQRVWILFSIGGKNKYIADQIDDLNKRYKSYKEEIDDIEDKFGIAKQIIKELDKNFSFKSFKAMYHERAFGKQAQQPKIEKRITDLSELWDIFERESPISKKTKDQYRIAYNWIIKKHGKISIENLNIDFFNSLSEYIKKQDHKEKIAAYKKKHGVEPASTAVKTIEDVTINSYIRGINAVCAFLHNEGHIDHWESPFGKGRKKIKIINKVSTGKAIKDDHLQRFVNYVPTDKNRALQEFAWCFYMLSFQCGGMNPIDIYGLKNKDMQAGELHYVRRKTSSTTNNVNETEIEIPNLAKLIFEKFGNPNPKQPDSYVFPFWEPGFSETQVRNKTDSINKEINKGLAIICKELDVPAYKLGGARHSQATYLADAMGDDTLIESIAKRMAHNNTEVTQTHYIKLTKNKKLRIKALLDALVENNTYFTAEKFFATTS